MALLSILEQLQEQQEKRPFFDAIRFTREQDLTAKKLNYSWESIGHKIYPSSIKSLTMCPYRFIHEDVHKPPAFTVEVVYRMELGKALHTMLQEEACDIKGLLYPRPNLRSESLAIKMDEIWPEIPLYDSATGISGRADAVLNLWDQPVVFDIKTTSVPDVRKSPSSGEWEVDRWNSYRKRLPSSEHKMQVLIYAYLMNKYEYYPVAVKKAGLGYFNTLINPGSVEAEAEYYFDITDDMLAKVGDLLHHLSEERRKYLDGIESECSYPACREHNKKKESKEAEDSTNNVK